MGKGDDDVAAIGVGSKVVLSESYAECSDAKEGPLRSERDYGIVIHIDASSKPYKVKVETGPRRGRTWWYQKQSLNLYDESSFKIGDIVRLKVECLDAVGEDQCLGKIEDRILGKIVGSDAGFWDVVAFSDPKKKISKFLSSQIERLNYDVKINKAGYEMKLGAKSGKYTYYCSRELGRAIIPGSDGQCGPFDGPQCQDCRSTFPTALKLGDIVERGPDWRWDEQDGGPGSKGTVVRVTPGGTLVEGWVRISWKNSGIENHYRYGCDDAFDVKLCFDESSSSQNSASAQIVIGSRVIIASENADKIDLENGPLKIGDEGTVIDSDEEESPYRVEALTGARAGEKWWYRAKSIQLVDPTILKVGDNVRLRPGVVIRNGCLDRGTSQGKKIGVILDGNPLIGWKVIDCSENKSQIPFQYKHEWIERVLTDVKVNRSGYEMKMGSRDYYCGRILGVMHIPGSDGQCGPRDGPQCPDCKAAPQAVDKLALPNAIHSGDWRDQSKLKNYCALNEASRGHGMKLCKHTTPVIFESHWSCCGSTNRSVMACLGSNSYVFKLKSHKHSHMLIQIPQSLKGKQKCSTCQSGDSAFYCEPCSWAICRSCLKTENIKVRLRELPVKSAEMLQKGHGGWVVNRIKMLMGRTGDISHIDNDGDIFVAMDDGGRYCFNPTLLECIPVDVGSKVRISQIDSTEAERIQQKINSWDPELVRYLGRIGHVGEIYGESADIHMLNGPTFHCSLSLVELITDGSEVAVGVIKSKYHKHHLIKVPKFRNETANCDRCGKQGKCVYFCRNCDWDICSPCLTTEASRVKVKPMPPLEFKISQEATSIWCDGMDKHMGTTGVISEVKSDGNFLTTMADGDKVEWGTYAVDFVDVEFISEDEISEGSRVILSEAYMSFGDARDGPLKPKDEGIVLITDDSAKPYLVRAVTGSSVGKIWWYKKKALTMLATKTRDTNVELITMSEEISVITQFLKNNCGLSNKKAELYAAKLVDQEDIASLKKMNQIYSAGKLEDLLIKINVSEDDIQLIVKELDDYSVFEDVKGDGPSLEAEEAEDVTKVMSFLKRCGLSAKVSKRYALSLVGDHNIGSIKVIEKKHSGGTLASILESINMQQDEMDLVLCKLGYIDSSAKTAVAPAQNAVKNNTSLDENQELDEDDLKDVETVADILKEHCELPPDVSRKFGEKLVVKRIMSMTKLKSLLSKERLEGILKDLGMQPDHVAKVILGVKKYNQTKSDDAVAASAAVFNAVPLTGKVLRVLTTGIDEEGSILLQAIMEKKAKSFDDIKVKASLNPLLKALEEQDSEFCEIVGDVEAVSLESALDLAVDKAKTYIHNLGGGKKFDLELDELAMVMLYCMDLTPLEYSYYHIVNRALAAKERKEFAVSPFIPSLSLTLNALKKLPLFTGGSSFTVVYRAADVGSFDWKQYKHRDIVRWSTFASCVSNKAHLKTVCLANGWMDYVTLTIHLMTRSARDISQFASSPSSEAEIVLPPASRFVVDSANESTLQVVLREVDPYDGKNPKRISSEKDKDTYYNKSESM